MNEEWRDIKGFEGVYQISNFGNVKTLNRVTYLGRNKKSTRIEKECIRKIYRKATYLRINLMGKYYSIHRLVAEAFIENKNGCKYVNHKNGDKHDNIVSNLEWVSHSENMKHAFSTGLKSNKNGNHSMAKLVIDLETGIFYDCIKEAAIARGLNQNTLSDRLKGRKKNNTSIRYA